MGESAVTRLIRWLFVIGSAGAFGYSIYTNILNPTQPLLYLLYPPLYMWDEFQNWEMAFMVLGFVGIICIFVSYLLGRKHGKKKQQQVVYGGYWQ